MNTYIYNDNRNLNTFWEICIQMRKPFIELSKESNDITTITCEMLPVLIDLEFTKNPVTKLNEFYNTYLDFNMLNKETFQLTIESKSITVKVLAKHAEAISEQLFYYIQDFAKNNTIQKKQDVI